MTDVTAIVKHDTLGLPQVIPGGTNVMKFILVGWQAKGLVSRSSVAVGLVGNKRDEKLAERLVKAINDGKAVTNVRIAKDVNGEDYVVADEAYLGRTLNADLKRLGY